MRTLAPRLFALLPPPSLLLLSPPPSLLFFGVFTSSSLRLLGSFGGPCRLSFALLRPPSPSFALLRLRPSSCCVPSSSSSFTSSPYLRDPFFCLRALSLTSRPPRLSNATAIGRRRRRPEAREHGSCGCRLGIDESLSCVLPVSVPTADAIEASEGVRASDSKVRCST